MAQPFVLHGHGPSPRLILAKVVDDFLLAGDKDEIRQFREAISKRFIVGQFTDSGNLVSMVSISPNTIIGTINYQWKSIWRQ